MKLLHFALFAIIVAFGSCKKEKETSNDGNYFFTCKIDGVEKNFSKKVVCGNVRSDMATGFLLRGFESEEQTSGGMMFTVTKLTNEAPVAKGTYTGTEAGFLVIAAYRPPGDSDESFQTGTVLYEDAEGQNVTIQNKLNFTITELDKTFARGTFSGDFYFEGDSETTSKKHITEGRFYVKMETNY